MHFVYILYSPIIDRYYIGETFDIEQRLIQHNQGFFKDSFTKIADDWILKRLIACPNIIVARKIEKHIKSKKRRSYTEKVIKEDSLCLELVNLFY
jgi:putative endonuclease